ncbi:MAG: AAA family ATPase [Bryobacteraceae bacterium]
MPTPTKPERRDDLDQGLPSDVDAERLVLGAVLVNDSRWPELSELIPEDFTVERHRQVFKVMCNLRVCNSQIDRVTMAEALRKQGFGDDTLSFLMSLDEGMPDIVHLPSWVLILQRKSILRRVIREADKAKHEALLEHATPDAILSAHLTAILELAQRGSRGSRFITELPSIRDYGPAAIEYLREPELPRGAVIALTGDSGCGKSTLALAWAGEVARAGTPVLVLDRENPISIVKERFNRLGIEDGPMLRYWGGWLPQPVPQPNCGEVLAWVKSRDPKPLVIVDSMVAFHGGDENDAGQTRACVQRCRILADMGATALLIHHDGKADSAKQYRGSSDFKAAVDVAFHVSNYPGADGLLGVVRLNCYKSRFGFTGQIMYHYCEGRFERNADTMKERLNSILRTHPGAKAVEFENLATQQSLSRKHARDFLKNGILDQTIRCERGHGRTKKFYLAVADGGNLPSRHP